MIAFRNRSRSAEEPAFPNRNCAESRSHHLSLSCRATIATVIALGLQTLAAHRARAGENHLDYKFEYYAEEDGRIKIQTHSVLWEQAIHPKLSLKGEFVYDAISGASPTGAPPPPGSKKVPTADVDDTRTAGHVEAALRMGNHTVRPQIAYSTEDDYDSIGISLTDSIDLNEKNTTLTFGIAHAFDTIQPEFWSSAKHKDSTDALIGITQLLSPKTVFTANFTFGYSWGYLSDPYKGVRFDGYPDPTSIFPEKRPDHKAKEILYLSLIQFFDPLHASGEFSYRFYNDSFGIVSHTATIMWHQKIGRHVIISPLFRFYTQTEADFYAVRRPGDPSDPGSPVKIPRYYSADYRLSDMNTYTYGIKATVILSNWLYLDAAYKRYEMVGNDNTTPDDVYPQANVFTVGFRVWY